MKQTSFLDPGPPVPQLPPRPASGERVRLSGQCAKIIQRLKAGRATNRELSAIALKYSGRVSECRQAGYDIRVVNHDRETGVVVYELKGEPRARGNV